MRLKNILISFFILIGLVLLFKGGPDQLGSRSIQNLWNSGHILFFALCTYLAINHWPKLREQSFLKQFLIVFLFSLIIGGVIELIQFKTNRLPDIGDLRKDIVGGLLVIVFLSHSRSTIKKSRLMILQITMIILFLFEVVPFIKALTDELIAAEQFPILSNFESSFEIDRWHGDAEISIDDQFSYEGEASLKIILSNQEYSGASLDYFPGNWKDYKILHFSIYSSEKNDITLICRVHDEQHLDTGQMFNDRFNRRLTIKPGWNEINIKIDGIINSPETRKMDITKIKNLMIFAFNLKNEHVIYLDDIKLLN